MTDSIHDLLSNLPETSLTTRVLGALDYLAPGEWQNIRSLEEMVKHVTGESDDAVIQAVGEKAIALWFDESTGYQRAATIYKLVDSGSTVAGLASFANMASEKFEVLSFLGKVTPKPDATQAVDAGVKFVAELAAFCSMNGIPGNSVGDFVGSLTNAAKEESMRFTTWIALDLVLPLGPDFLSKLLGTVQGAIEGQLSENRLFKLVSEHLPGDLATKKQLLTSTLESAQGSITQKVAEKDITQGGLLARVRSVVDVTDDKLDAVAAAIDMSTNYFEHTGIQTVARRLVTRAYGEI